MICCKPFANRLCVFLIGTAEVFLSGCMPSQNFRGEDRLAIQTIYLAPEVSMPSQPMVLTREMGFGAGIGGAIGASLASLGGTSEEQTAGYLAKNDIHVDALLAKEFAQELNLRKPFQNEVGRTRRGGRACC